MEPVANPVHASADVCVDKKGKARKGISIMLKYRCPSIEQTASGVMSYRGGNGISKVAFCDLKKRQGKTSKIFVLCFYRTGP